MIMEPRAREHEGELLKEAIGKFAAATGVDIRIVDREYAVGPGRRLDALADIHATTGTKTYAIEIKRHLTTAKVGLVAQQLLGIPYRGMLITDYVNPEMAERLKEMQLAFIDLAGNAYLNEPPIYVYIKGNRPTNHKTLGLNLKPTRAFQTTGLKVLFGLLTKDELLQAPYREIANETGVALGTIGWVLTDLKDHGYLYEGKGRPRQITQRKQIIERWVTAYPEKLRPKLKLGRYRAPAHRWWKDVQLEVHKAQWGGEIAAAKLTDYLMPEKAVIYADAVPPRLLAANQLKVDPEGDVEILRRFWKPNRVALNTPRPDVLNDVAPPLLVYADLMATGDERNVETARLIYDKFIDGHFGQD